MPITKIQVHGVADTAGELEEIFHRLERGLTQFVADKGTFDEPEESFTQRDDDGNIQYAMSDLKFTPKLNQTIHDELVSYVVGHATFTVWRG